MSTIKVATSYVDETVFRKMGDSIVGDSPIEGFKGTRTVAKLQEGRTYNFVTKVANQETNYKAVLVVSGNRVTREFNADGEDQTFSITLGSGEDGLYINNSENVGVIVSYEQDADFDPKPVDFKTPQPFRFWCQTVLPLVYDDSLSYYELLSKVVNYLNSLINDVTNVENIYVNLVNAYTELEGYVNTYFDNLDVSEAINEKLDYMADHGEFDSLVQEALSRINYTAIIDAEVDEQLPVVVDSKLPTEVETRIDGVVRNQISDVVSHQIGFVVDAQLPDVVDNKLPSVVNEQIGGAIADQIGEAVIPATENWLSRNITEPPVDPTLKIENACAESKTVGKMFDYTKDIDIAGYERKEYEIFDTPYSNSYFQVAGSNLYKFMPAGNPFNCMCINNLIGGARYKIKLNADVSETSGYTNLKAGYLCKDVVTPTEQTTNVQATVIDTLENYIGQYPNGEYYIDIPYNATAIVFNSLNDTLCKAYRVSMEYEGEILPSVTNADNGKILSVVNGEWDKANIPDGNLPVVSSSDNGKVLQVQSGEWTLGENLDETISTVNDIVTNVSQEIPSTINIFDELHNSIYVDSSDIPSPTITEFKRGTVYLRGYVGDVVLSTKGTRAGYFSNLHVYDESANDMGVSIGATVNSAPNGIRQGKLITIPQGASFFTFKYRTNTGDTPLVSEVMVTKGNTIGTTYIPYSSYPVIVDTVKENLDNVPVYVSLNGDDGNDGLTFETAFATFNRALSRSHNIIAERGTYYQDITIDNMTDVSIVPYDNNTSFSWDKLPKIELNGGEIFRKTELTLDDNLYTMNYEGGYMFREVFTLHSSEPIANADMGIYRVNVYVHLTTEGKLKLKPVLTLQECSENNTFFWDGTTLYCNIATTDFDSISILKNLARVTINESNNVKLRDVVVKYNYGYVIQVAKSNNVTLENCEASYSGTLSGFYIENSSVKLSQCFASYNAVDGFNLHEYGESELIDCVAYYNFDDGCSHHQQSDGTIYGGKFVGNGKAGIAPAYGANVNIYNALCVSNDSYGIAYLWTTDRPAMKGIVSGCAVVDNPTGIKVEANCTVDAIGLKYSDNTTDKTVLGTLNEY